MRRKKGNYWVRIFRQYNKSLGAGKWIIAYWQGKYWELSGSSMENYFNDESFHTIDERKITRTA